MQTAVEWLGQQICDNWNDIHHGARNALEFIEKAKEMEKQQIEEAFYCGNQIYGNWDADSTIYYNETYGSKGSDENFKQFSLYEHKETITSADTITSSQIEISDEEIVKKAFEYKYKLNQEFFCEGAKWYREQLKKK